MPGRAHRRVAGVHRHATRRWCGRRRGAGKPPVNGGGNLYTVVSGDSLSVIAGRKWNDVLLWPILYDANKQVIGSNPNLIKPGQKLTVPSIAGYSASQLSATRERGRNWR
ncbi:MAG: LysM peptidoglycan-binding domain-containing protein [Acidobacteria bacterium]|nr:LysM peptidoglycan-binding domain-containing protein [Acidobacteriota bacterium]